MGLLLTSAPQAEAAPPAWKLTVTPNADYFPPAPDENAAYTIIAENIGGTTTSSQPIVIEDTLPPGLTPYGPGNEAVYFYAEPYAPKGPQPSGLPYGIELSGPEIFDLAHRGLCPTALRCEYPGSLAGTLPNVKHGERLAMLVRAAVPADFPFGPIEDSVSVSGGGAPKVEAHATNMVGTEPPYGFSTFEARLTDPSRTASYAQAGGHPYQLSTEFNFTTIAARAENSGSWQVGNVVPAREVDDLTAALPSGMIGNPQAVPHCQLAEFFALECEPSTVVGFVGYRAFESAQGGFKSMTALYNLQPLGTTPGLLGYLVAGGLPFFITTHVRSGGDYGLDETGPALPPAQINRIRVTVWGVPADHSHDKLRRKTCGGVGFNDETGFWGPRLANSPDQNERECEVEPSSDSVEVPDGGAAGVPPTPFLTMPTECSGRQLTVEAISNSWGLPDDVANATSILPEPVSGCNQLSFEPSIESRPTTNLADAPTGYEFTLHVPQHEGCVEEPSKAVNCEPATSDLKEAVVKLPAGLTVNPSSANGLAGCSPEQIGLKTPAGQTPAHFTEVPAQCPEASAIGTAEVNTPLLHNPLDGVVYLATPHQNPFGSLLAAYIVLEGEGLIVKLPGKIETDSATGQITGRFTENPQTPFEDFHLRFFEGAQGDLRTPAVCGSYKTTSQLTPYSHLEGEEEATPIAEPSAEFKLENGGAPCPKAAAEQPNGPVFKAGTESSQAGTFTPLGFRLAREDGSQEIEKIETALPPGLTGKLAGVAECSEAQIAVALAREHEGGGAEEKASPACPASSEVGVVQVASGAGPTPLYVTGHAYLAGPYKGAPLSLAIITPAVAGPFDLGDVVVRTALYVDPETARIKAVSDPIPHILQGIPLDVRSITLNMNRPSFTLNPTNCEELHFGGSETSLLGNVAPLSQRFQVGGCSALPFKPKLSISLKGGTKRSGTPALKAVLKMPPGNANVASAQVTLPHSEFLDQGHLENICTRVQFNEHACPATSIYGHAVAYTPLLDHPLEGPVYLRSSSHLLPDLAVDLEGQINVVLDSKVDSVHESLRNTFELVPDAPVSKFVLTMKGGKHSLIENSTDICLHRQRATGLFRGQNGRTVEVNPLLQVHCKGKGKHKHGKKHRRGR